MRHIFLQIIVLSALLYTSCIPEYSKRERHAYDFSDVSQFQDRCFSALLFGIQGMQITCDTAHADVYEVWPGGFNILRVSDYSGDLVYNMNSADSFLSDSIGFPYHVLDIYMDIIWPAAGGIATILYSSEDHGHYTIELFMIENVSGDKWKMRAKIKGSGDQYQYVNEGKWEAHYEVIWDRGNPETFQDDALAFIGLGKCALKQRKSVLNYVLADTMFIRAEVPGIWGDDLRIFGYNLPMAKYSQDKLFSAFPDSYKFYDYSTPVRGESQGYSWNDHFQYLGYADFMRSYEIVKQP